MATYLNDLQNLNAAAPKHRGLNGNDGFQEAHGIGFSLAKTQLVEFRGLAGFTLKDFNQPWNLVHAADTEAGSRTIGGGFHRGSHVIEYDKIAYDFDNPLTSQKYLNVLEREVRDNFLLLNQAKIGATPEQIAQIDLAIEAARADMRLKTAARLLPNNNTLKLNFGFAEFRGPNPLSGQNVLFDFRAWTSSAHPLPMFGDWQNDQEDSLDQPHHGRYHPHEVLCFGCV